MSNPKLSIEDQRQRRKAITLWLTVGCIMIILERLFTYGWTGDRVFMLVALTIVGFLNAPDRTK